MAWKYIMFEVKGKELTFSVPIIFPDKLIHVDMAKYAMHIVMRSFPKFDCDLINAGMIDSIEANATHGMSETLHLNSDKDDVNVINLYQYQHGYK